MASRFAAVRAILERGVAERTFPAATIEVGTATQPLWQHAAGGLTYAPDARPATADTIYDLASLTKVLSTTPLVMRQVERGTLGLDDLVAQHLAGWRGADREQVTIRDLLSHCSGLPGHRDLWRDQRGADAFIAAIAGTPLEYAPRTRSIYSDLGFVLLGFILSASVEADLQVGLPEQFDTLLTQPPRAPVEAGLQAGLPRQFDTLLTQMGGIQELQFHPPALWKPRTAPTQVKDYRGGLLVGEVDDDNTWALGGAAAHAGLFGTAGAVGECARHVLQVLRGRTGAFRADTLREFITRRAEIPGSSRALGWDTMLPTSSCGTRMSPRAFGHTGFTGTSLWIDPERDLYVVLLTNRVHPTAGDVQLIRQVRRDVHDAVIEELG